jgi:biopolymer transport protein ExbB
LLGLLGTVIGMIKVFAAITTAGVGDPQILAGGIYEALITTAAGLSVGIPSLMFHRYFRGRINELTVEIEQQALRLLEVLRGRLPR